MKKIFLIILALFFNQIYSQVDIYQFGAKGHDGILDIAVDDESNIYITGFFQGKLNGLKANGDTDAFIAKIGINKELLWFKQIGSNYKGKNEITEFGKFICVDNKRNSYVLGLYYDDLTFSKSQKITSLGKQDTFLTKFNSKGEKVWIKTYGTLNDENVLKLIIDKNDNIYTIAKLDVDESNRSVNVINKYNTDGILLWSKDIKYNNDVNVKIKKIDYKNNQFYILLNYVNKDYFLAYDLNAQIINEQSFLNSDDVISFAVSDDGNAYNLVVNKSKKNTNGNFKIISNSNFKKVAWSKEYSVSGYFKPNNIIIDEEWINIIGSYQEKIGDKTHSTSSLIYQYDLLGELVSISEYIGKFQNKINKYFIKNNTLYSVGQFYNQIEIDNKSVLSSKGKTDSFIDIELLEKNNPKIDVESEINEVITIYPNPNNGEFFIRNIEKVKKIELYELNGKLVFKKEINSNSIIKIDSLNEATYNLIIYKKDNKIRSFKLLIRRQ